MQAQGVMQQKTSIEQWKETQRKSSSDLGLETPMEQNQWKSAYAGVNGVAQGRVQLGSWGTAGKRKDTV